MEPREIAALLPESPGVYLFKDAGGNVLYVGKAASLRSRVRSYFLESSWVNAKTGSLAREIADLETILVGNEREALALEHNLIKKYRPKFNVMLRDDKTYPYIKFTAAEKYPSRVFHPPHQKGRFALFWPLFPRRTRAPDSAFRSQAFSRPELHGRSHTQPSAAVFAVLHSSVPRPVRYWAHNGRALC